MRILQQSLKNLRAHCGLFAFRQRARRTCFLVRSKHHGGGFAVFGAEDPINAYARRYLNEETADGVTITRTRHVVGTTQQARRLANDLGLVVFLSWSAPNSLRKDLLSLEAYVSMTIPLPDTLEAYQRGLGGKAKANIRRVVTRGYRAEVSEGTDWATEFYERYHLPSVRERHGADGFCSSPADLVRLFEKGNFEWIRVFSGDECISAVIGERRSGSYYLHRLGWRNGSPALLAAGASAALYWFSIQRTFELGLPHLDLGGAAPCLDNGTFDHKTAWGGRLMRTERRFQERLVLIDPAHPDARAFISKHSLLVRAPDDRFMVISSRLPAEVPAFSAQSEFIVAWFRLRDTPSEPVGDTHELLPASLRRWFDSVPLPASPARR